MVETFKTLVCSPPLACASVTMMTPRLARARSLNQAPKSIYHQCAMTELGPKTMKSLISTNSVNQCHDAMVCRNSNLGWLTGCEKLIAGIDTVVHAKRLD